MGGFDTSMGGAARSFPTTRWSMILGAADRASPQNREHLDRLLRAYWKPVYAYVRAAWGKNVEDAKDLTQAFFIEILRRDFIARFQPDRGSFRAYLKVALKHFLSNARRAEDVRRAVEPAFSLDAAPGELERMGPAAPDEPPDRAYDREWSRALLDGAVESLRDLLARQGKEKYFDVFRKYCLPSGETEPTHAEVAAALGISTVDVANFLAYARRALRQILKERVRDYVASDGDVDAELRDVLGS